jgi:raffinose/stachyose/melibiose transport system permease protein
MSGKAKKRWKLFALYAILLILALIWIVPLFTLIATALKHKKDFMSGLSLFQLPAEIAWDNFSKAIEKGRLLGYMKNDLIVSFLKVPLGILVGSLAAFALTRTNMKHKTAWFVFLLIGMMLPMQTALVPINIIYNKLDLLNTYFGLFYVYVGFGISYCVLVMRGFMMGIPKDLDEAAYIDGCTKWKLYYMVIMPIAKPAFATLFITDFLATWNEYLLASVIINDNRLKTVPPGLLTFVGEHGTDYGFLCAGVLITVIPVMVVYLAFQRYFVEGMAGAVKS